MLIETASPVIEQPQHIVQPIPIHSTKKLPIIPIAPEQTLEEVLVALRLHALPVVLHLPEQSHVFDEPSHFARLRQHYAAHEISFLVPRPRLHTLGRMAHAYGFSFAPSLASAASAVSSSALLLSYTATGGAVAQEQRRAQQPDKADTGASKQQRNGVDVPSGEKAPSRETHRKLAPSGVYSAEAERKEAARPLVPPSRIWHTGRIAVLMALVALAVVVLLPALFSGQPALMGTSSGATSLAPLSPVTPASVPVGQLVFTSSGQLDATGTQGITDGVSVRLSHLTALAHGQRYYGWLLPAPTDVKTSPLLLGPLTIQGGQAHLSYTDPAHKNLLMQYAGVVVTAQASSLSSSSVPAFSAQSVRYTGSLPDSPTPGDEQGFSLLDHVRHLLAADPMLAQQGLQGGVAPWLSRNTEKVLEWSSAARDSWSSDSANNPASIHRQMLRVLDYLDGATVAQTGDVPAGSPWLVDPRAGAMGLLSTSQHSPSYVAHVRTHLEGVIHAPGHTVVQQRLAHAVDDALTAVTAQLLQVQHDAVILAHMDTAHLHRRAALLLLDDLVTHATTAYVGQFDPTLGAETQGASWIGDGIQELATISLIVTPKSQPV